MKNTATLYVVTKYHTSDNVKDLQLKGGKCHNKLIIKKIIINCLNEFLIKHSQLSLNNRSSHRYSFTEKHHIMLDKKMH